MDEKSIFRFGGSSSNNAEDYYISGITTFKFREIAAATKNFAQESLLGEGEYGRTFKAFLTRSGQVICKLVVNGEEFTTVADPELEGRYPEQGLYQALSLAAECLHHKDVTRPRIGYVLNVVSNLASEIYDDNAIQISRAGTLAVGNIEKERLTQQWRGVRCFFV